MKKTMPYIVYLTLPTIKPRHFRKLLTMIKAKIAEKSEKVVVAEEESEVEIQEKLNNTENQLQDIESYWLQQELCFVQSEMGGVEQELDAQQDALIKLDSHIMSLILMDAQSTDKKEISNIIFQTKIDQLSNLEDTLTTWLDLQNQLKMLVPYYGERKN